MRVAIVGAGLMGAQIGCEYALGGHDVTLIARDAAAAEQRVEASLQLVEEHALGATAQARERLRVTSDPAVECDVAVESVPEDLELKARLLREVAARSPEAVLASNTSSIPITALGDAVGAPERVVGTHYLNPPLLMPPVEVVAGERTDPTVVATVTATLRALGKQPVLVRRDVPGFVWNRLQFALLRECAAIGLGGVDTWNRAGSNLVPEISTADELGDLSRFVAADADELKRLGEARDSALADELRSER